MSRQYISSMFGSARTGIGFKVLFKLADAMGLDVIVIVKKRGT